MKVEPCPFCGGTNISPDGCWGCDEGDNDTVAARCHDCGAQGPSVLIVDKSPYISTEPGSKTMAASTAAWNLRS